MTVLSIATAALTPCSAADVRPLPPAALSCLECHADVGGRDAAAPPALVALTPDAIAAALDAFRSGTRAGTIMPRLAGGFSRAEARALAEALGRPRRPSPEGSPTEQAEPAR